MKPQKSSYVKLGSMGSVIEATETLRNNIGTRVLIQFKDGRMLAARLLRVGATNIMVLLAGEEVVVDLLQADWIDFQKADEVLCPRFSELAPSGLRTDWRERCLNAFKNGDQPGFVQCLRTAVSEDEMRNCASRSD